VRNNEDFSRDGDDLLCTLEVPMTDAIFGTEASIPALDGTVDVEVRSGIQSGEILTIKGRGITKLRGSGRGDLRIGIQVVTPTKLDHKERQLMESFANGRKQSGPQLASFHQGIFSKLRDRFRG
jgi:molecular chaperone DnaJ